MRKDSLNLLAGLPRIKKSKGKAKPEAPEPMEPAGVTAEKEISALKKAFIERSDRENQRYTQAVDSEYWFAICFQSREQKNHFLKEIGLHLWGSKYFDGAIVAKKFGIKLPPALPSRPLKKVDPKLAALAMEI